MTEEQIYTVAGFSSKFFWYQIKIANFPNNLICQSCRCIVPKLNTLSCGHWCCGICLKGMRIRNVNTRSYIFKCSFCRMNTSEVVMTTNVKKQELETRIAACPNNGCSFSGRIREIKKHVMFCKESLLIRCWKCNCEVQQDKMAKHLRVDCDGPIQNISLRSSSSCSTFPRENPPRIEHWKSSLDSL